MIRFLIIAQLEDDSESIVVGFGHTREEAEKELEINRACGYFAVEIYEVVK